MSRMVGGIPRSLANVLEGIEQLDCKMPSSAVQIKAMARLEEPGVACRNESARVYTVPGEGGTYLVAVYWVYESIEDPERPGWFVGTPFVVGADCSCKCHGRLTPGDSTATICNHLLIGLALADSQGMKIKLDAQS